MILTRICLAFVQLEDAFLLELLPRTGRGGGLVIVMPRSRSCSIQSVTVVPSCTSPMR